MKNISAEAFLDGIRNKDKAFIQVLLKEISPLIKKYVVNNSGTEQDAEDLITEAFIVIFQKTKTPDFNITCSISTYVYSICKNLWHKHLRTRKWKSSGDPAQSEQSLLEDDFFQAIEKNEKATLCQQKIQLLDKPAQYILFLFYVEKKSYHEIAQIMELKSAGYAKKLKFLAQQALIQLVKADPRYNELKS